MRLSRVRGTVTGYRWRDPARRQASALTPEDTIMHAITSPGVLTARRQHEPLPRWQARAVLAAVRELAAGHERMHVPAGVSSFAATLKENPGTDSSRHG